MSTNNDTECRPSLRIMSFQAAVSSLYARSKGLIFLVAVKWRSKVLINPPNQYEGKSKGKNSDKRKCKDTNEYPQFLGDCEAAFLISPSWEVAWEMMTEEDDRSADENADKDISEKVSFN